MTDFYFILSPKKYILIHADSEETATEVFRVLHRHKDYLQIQATRPKVGDCLETIKQRLTI